MAKTKSEPFPFMADKDHDMVVAIRLTADEPTNLRRMTVYYKLTKLISSFEHDVTEPKYKGDYLEFTKDMWQLLVGEIKSRVLANQEFSIWFYSQRELNYVVEECLKFTHHNKALRKYGKKIEDIATLVPKT